MTAPPSLPGRLRTTATAAADQTSRWTHIAATILRAGVVPFPRVHRGLAELRPLVRYGTTLGDAESLRAHVKAHLARFSVPRDVVVLDELPRNPTGKVLARELRELLG